MVRLTIQTYHLCNSFSFVSLLLVHYLHSERNLVPYLEQYLELQFHYSQLMLPVMRKHFHHLLPL